MKVQSAMRAWVLVTMIFAGPVLWGQAPAGAKPPATPAGAKPPVATPPAPPVVPPPPTRDLEDSAPGLSKEDAANREEVEKMLRGDLGEKAGDKKRFTIRTKDDLTGLAANDIYKNEETAYKIVSVTRSGTKGGRFVVERISGQNDPQRRWLRLAGTGPKTMVTHLTLLDLYIQGGPFLHPIALLFLAMVILTVNGCLIFRRKVQCDPLFVASAEEALLKGDLGRFNELARSHTGLMPFICRHMTQDFDNTPMNDIRRQVEVATGAHIARMRIPVRALNLIAVAAPLLGLLGTIVGMVIVFEGVAGTSGAAKASILASGIRVKLFSTASALIVAIPALFLYFGFNQKLGVIINECDLVHERFLSLLARIKRQRGDGAEEKDGGNVPRSARHE
jgi:biopolymer transport protein ExbB